MPTVLDAVVTSPTFNCYCTLAEAEAFFDKRLHDSVWTSATTANKESALMWATATLDTLPWRGVRTSGTQPLYWPRKGMSYVEAAESNTYSPIEVYDSYGYVSTTITIADNEIPQVLKNATAELALSLMTSDSTVPSSAMPAGISEIKVDSIGLKFSKTSKYGFLSSNIRNMLAPLLTNSSPYNAPVVRV